MSQPISLSLVSSFTELARIALLGGCTAFSIHFRMRHMEKEDSIQTCLKCGAANEADQ